MKKYDLHIHSKFSDGASIIFLLMKWRKLINVTKDNKKCLKFKASIVIDKKFETPEVFKIDIDESGSIKNIENLKFDYDK